VMSNQAFHPTPSQLRARVPRPLRGRGARERRRYVAGTAEVGGACVSVVGRSCRRSHANA
jgi:hypothetical protein